MARRTKKKRPFGCVFQRGDKWIFYVGLNGERIWKTFATEDSAELYRARLYQRKLNGELDELEREEADKKKARQKRQTLFADFAQDKWLPYVTPRVKRRTAETYATHCRCHLLPVFGEYQLEEIDRELIDGFLSDWAAGGPMFRERLQLARERENERWRTDLEQARAEEARLAATEGREPRFIEIPRRSVRLGRNVGTIQNGLTALRACLGWAVRWDYLVTNPAEGVELPRGEHREMQPLTREQFDRLLAELEGDARLVVMTAVSTGVRRGELFALRWRDFDREARRLWVRRSVDRYGTIHEPKTSSSKRAIGLPSELVQELRAYRLRSSFSTDDDLIFPNTKGAVMDAGNFVRREFRPALKDAGLPMIRFHDLRHTFASLLINARPPVPLKVVSEALGHASISITVDRYSHLYDSAIGDAGDAMSSALFGSVSRLEAATGTQASGRRRRER